VQVNRSSKYIKELHDTSEQEDNVRIMYVHYVIAVHQEIYSRTLPLQFVKSVIIRSVSCFGPAHAGQPRELYEDIARFMMKKPSAATTNALQALEGSDVEKQSLAHGAEITNGPGVSAASEHDDAESVPPAGQIARL
jgi:hypothetical protein